MHNILFGGSMTTFTTEDLNNARTVPDLNNRDAFDELLEIQRLSSKLFIHVKLKTNYGSQTIYPNCDKAKIFCKLLNQTTLTPLNIRVITQALDNMDRARPNDRATSAQRAMTLEEIAEVFGTSRERIRQIEQNAMRKLRIRLRAKGIDLKDYLPD